MPAAQQDLQSLCFVNLKYPPPEEWVEVHRLIRECLQAYLDSLPPGSPAQQEAAARAEAVTLEWLLSVLSRMHVNTFR